jgi:Ser-tRNA(Ala) deacylase AlaX
MACGCVQKGTDEAKTNLTQTPVTQNASDETSAKVRYVQLNFLNWSHAGGKHVSETAAFTTIQLMYLYIVRDQL